MTSDSSTSSLTAKREKTREPDVEKPELSARSSNDDISAHGVDDKIDEDVLFLQHAADEKKDKKADPKDKPKPIPVIKLFRFATKFDLLLCVVGTVCSLAAGVVTPTMTVIFSSLVQALINFNMWLAEGKKTEAYDLLNHEARKYCLWFLILGLIMWVVAYGVNVCWAIAAENQGLRIRELYYSSIMRQDIGWFDVTETGELTTRITNDVNLIQDGISEKLGFVIMNIVSFLTGFIIAFVKAWDVAFICLCVLPFMIAAVAFMGKRIARWTVFAQDHTAGSGAVAEEVLNSIRTVHALNGQERELERYRAKITESYLFGRKKGFILGSGIGFVFFSIFVMYCVAFNFGIWRIYHGKHIPQQVLNAIFALLIGGIRLGSTAPQLSALSTAQGCAVKVFEAIDRVSPINALSTDTGRKVDKLSGHITFTDVHFSYPSRPDVTVLKGFNLDIRPGQKIALVGESGCGKSTTIGLIERFYDPAQGDVSIDGVNIKDYNIGSLRHRIGIVTQEPVLFSTTIMQNIKWGAIETGEEPPTDEEVIEAAKAANAHPFISQLPNGYDTLVGEGGALLSGGQKQRIAIA
ncbi:hypothetical protein GGI07_004907, partial [Coemansia sp. Benny D115]